MRIAVLGAGAGGAAAVADLVARGHEVVLWNRSPEGLAPFEAAGGIVCEGVLGEGIVSPAAMTTDLGSVVSAADVALVTVPTFGHAAIATLLARAGWPAASPVVLNPGHTGGALEFDAAFRSAGSAPPPIAEFSTLTYVARKYAPDTVTISGRADRVRAASLPGGGAALEAALELFSGAEPAPDVLATGLANVNLVLHPPGAILGAAWVEATGGDFTFYVQGMTPGVARVMHALDDERRSVARAFGHELPGLVAEMIRIGTVSPGVEDVDDYRAAISSGEANRRIRAPGNLAHRYYREDFGHGLLPFLDLAEIAGVHVPVAASLLEVGGALVGTDFRQGGRTAASMGIAGLSRRQLMERVACR